DGKEREPGEREEKASYHASATLYPSR
ncbi:Transposable element Tc3 transposase, partial [Fusarium oxysporum f. sp. albedinis]